MENDSITSALRDKLSTKLKAEELETVLNAVNEVLADYDVTPKTTKINGPDNLPETFLRAMIADGLSQKSIKHYRYVISRFLNSINEDTRKITADHIRKYFADEQERGISGCTVNGYRDVLSAYFGWLREDGLINKNPVIEIPPIKYRKKIRKSFTDIEIEKLKEACKTKRDRAIIYFLHSTACCISEMTALDRNSVDLDQLNCIVIGKGNKERIVHLDPVAGMMLREYLADRIDRNPALFIGSRIERITPGGVRTMLRELGKRAGVEDVQPSRFRRTRASKLLTRGMALQDVATILGHAKLDTTMKYIETNEENVRNAYRKYT